MKRIVLEDSHTVSLRTYLNTEQRQPLLVKFEGKIIGVVVNVKPNNSYMIADGNYPAISHPIYTSLQALIEDAMEGGYTFHIED